MQHDPYNANYVYIYMATSKNLSVHAVISRGSELFASYVSAMFELCFSYVFNAFQGTVLWFTFNRYFMDFKWESCQFCISSLLVFSIISMEFFKVAHRNCSDVHVFQYWRAWERTWQGHGRDCHSMVELLGGIQDFLWPFPVLLGGPKLLNLLGWPLGGSRNLAQNAFPDAWRVVPGLPSCIWRTGPSVIFVYYTRIVFARPGFRKFRPCVNIAWT